MSLEDLELTDLSNELSVRSVVRDILTSQDQNRPKFNYNSVKTLMVRKYGSNAFERVKPVVGKSMFCMTRYVHGLKAIIVLNLLCTYHVHCLKTIVAQFIDIDNFRIVRTQLSLSICRY